MKRRFGYFLSIFGWALCLSSAAQELPTAEAEADFLMVQMRYAEAAETYSKIEPASEGVKLKEGVAHFLDGNFPSALAKLDSLSSSTNSATREEALFYCQSSKLKVAERDGRFLYLDSKNLDYTQRVFAGLVSDESKAFREFLLSQILEHLLSRQSGNTKDAMLGAVELAKEQLMLLDQEDPRTKMLWVKFRYLQTDYQLVSKSAGELVASGAEIETDPFLYPAFRYLSRSLYAMGREEKVFLEGSGYVPECSTRADSALHYGVEYLRLQPDDEDFADWLSGKVLMSLFLQTQNPGYLVDILEVGHPAGDQLQEIYKLAKGVLRFSERRKTFDKADATLIDSMFSSEYWNRRGRIELIGRDTLLDENSVDAPAIQSIFTQNNGRVSILLGGAMLYQSKQEFLEQYALLHNNDNIRSRTLKILFATDGNHVHLSKRLFGNELKAVHKFIDTGYQNPYHRQKFGHSLKWLVNNLNEIIKAAADDGVVLTKKQAALVWSQHISQDFFSSKGIPTPLTEPARQFAHWHHKTFKKRLLGKTINDFAQYTTINALKVAKLANVAMWGWVAYETYDACQDFAAERDVADAKKDVQLALFYRDLGSSCDELARQLSEERSKERTAAENLSLSITLGRLYAMDDKSTEAQTKLKEVVQTCRDMKWELEKGVDADGGPDIEDQAGNLDKLVKKIKEVLINDDTFNAEVSCEAYAHEAMLLVALDSETRSVLGDALGGYERTGDKLLEQSKDALKVDVAWSAAVNYYRAARLAKTFGHENASRLAEKAVNTLFEMRKTPGVLTVTLLDKLRNDWLLEFGMNEKADNMEDIRVFREAIPKQIDWRELHLRKLTLQSELLEKNRDLVVELIRRSNGIEATLLREKLDGIAPGKPYVLLKRLPIGIASDDDYKLRILQRGVDVNKMALWVELYSSLYKGKGLASLVSAFESYDDLSIEADLEHVKPQVFHASAIRLSEQASIIAEEKRGIALFSMAGREPICLRECPIDDEMGLSLKGINLNKAKGSLAATGFPKVLMYVPFATTIDIEIRQSAPWVQDKLTDMIILAGTRSPEWSWVAAEHLTYDGSTDLVTSFHISEEMMKRESDGRNVYSIDGSALRFSKREVTPLKLIEN